MSATDLKPNAQEPPSKAGAAEFAHPVHSKNDGAMSSETMELSEAAASILELLEASGFDSYVVGGCVRDALLGRACMDFDIATAATPDQVKALIGQELDEASCVDIGLRHGTVQVHFGGSVVEVTTFRADGKYLDHRHPATVEFVSSIEEDLARRDFTMNAIAYHPKRGFIDPFGGRSDIAAAVIRTVGQPDQRFGEDALRILRALRFAAVLGFRIAEDTAASLHANRQLLQKIAAERQSAELLKLLVGEEVLPVLLEYAGVLATFIPEIRATIGFKQNSPYHSYDVWEHTARAIALSKPDATVRLTLLMHDLGKPTAYFMDEDGRGHFYGHNKIGEEIVRERLVALRFSNALINEVALAVLYHQLDLKPENLAKWLSRLGEKLLRLILEVKRGDMAAHAPAVVERQLQKIAATQAALDELVLSGLSFTRHDLVINGNDLIGIGIPRGHDLRAVLDYLLDRVIAGELENSREELLKAAEDYAAAN